MHIRAIRGSFRRRVFQQEISVRICEIRGRFLIGVLSGGAAVPAAPTKHSCTNINYPTEFTEFTETSGREEPPTDFTDAHRWLGCVGFSHRIRRTHRNDCRRIFSHGFHRCSQIFRLRRVLPRNSQNSQKLLAEKSLPQISQMPTDG